MNTSGLTSKGRREINQDSFYCGTIREITVLAVADGMGGHAGGEIASNLVIETVKEVLHADEASSVPLKKLLYRIFQSADSHIREKVTEDPRLDGMGSTLACLLIRGDTFVAGNIGDSRIYRINSAAVVPLTRDHTMLQQYVDEFGHPIPEDIQRNGHVLSRVADGSGDQPDLFPIEKEVYTLEKEDLFICLTDGLILKNDQNFEDYLKQAVLQNKTLESLTDRLLSDALESGSKDNCTVVAGSRTSEIKIPLTNENRAVLQTLNGETGKTNKSQRSRFNLLRFGLLSAGFILLLVFYFAWVNDSLFSDLITRNGIHAEKNGSLFSSSLEEDVIDCWPRGFTGLSASTPYYDGSKISWYSPTRPIAEQYHLNIYQYNQMIYQDSTLSTSFVLNDSHGYENGEITVELYASIGDSLFEPTSHARVTFNYQKNAE